MHSESFRLLPWYVKGQLNPEQARQVDSHMQGCLACRREAEGLTQLFCAHTQLSKPRPVDEARLDALFARIDSYETSRRRQPPLARNTGSVLTRLREMLTEWLNTRLMLVGGACAAILLAVAIGVGLEPTALTPAVETQQQVLSSPTTTASKLRVKLQLRSAMSQAEVERLIAATLTERKVQLGYRVEQRSGAEYAVIFEQTPDLVVLSELLETWRGMPSVVDAGIDATAGQ
jgi:anti-sigma factor RsiW